MPYSFKVSPNIFFQLLQRGDGVEFDDIWDIAIKLNGLGYKYNIQAFAGPYMEGKVNFNLGMQVPTT